MNPFDQGWKELNCEEKVGAPLSIFGAAHDVMLAKGDVVLSYSLLERIYLAMEQAR